VHTGRLSRPPPLVGAPTTSYGYEKYTAEAIRHVALIGPDIRALGNKINLKPGNGSTPVEWHQDFAHHPHTNSDLCAVGIALEQITEESVFGK
jgi:hypothetical protein